MINDKVINTGVLQSQSSLWGPGCLSSALEAYSVGSRENSVDLGRHSGGSSG